ncbi:hypothetical protein [Streptomyces sp. 11x1]|uniref:hypothetical protein n=1 Tax=Streptomyces sp. 11x1 TaxID=3038642 RepID=UPI002931AABA|nr:hypothetical protein [Streptomyces sp. 11x1]WNZ14916.1 hypothetical protein P8T65_46620 [Streptomyces sp. 11x1]
MFRSSYDDRPTPQFLVGLFVLFLLLLGLVGLFGFLIGAEHDDDRAHRCSTSTSRGHAPAADGVATPPAGHSGSSTATKQPSAPKAPSKPKAPAAKAPSVPKAPAAPPRVSLSKR